MTLDRLDPERISKLLGLNADKLRELEQALLEAQKAMTMFAAALAEAAEYLPKDTPAPDNADWQAANRLVSK